MVFYTGLRICRFEGQYAAGGQPRGGEGDRLVVGPLAQGVGPADGHDGSPGASPLARIIHVGCVEHGITEKMVRYAKPSVT